MSTRGFLAVAGIAAVLAGCGGSTAASGPSSTGTGSVTTSSSPTASPSLPSAAEVPGVAEVASVVAEAEASLRRLQADLTSNCDDQTPAGAVACGYTVVRAPVEAQLLSARLHAFRAIPEAIAPLTLDTLRDAKQLQETDVRACKKAPKGASCQAAKSAVAHGVENLLTTMAGWKPYEG